MTFFFNLIISILYCSLIDRRVKTENMTVLGHLFLYIPLILLWLFICGGQYAVGTDYFSYIRIFNGEKLDYYSQNGEILFSLFVKLCNTCGIRGQAIYFIIYSISFYCLFWIICRLGLRYSSIFVLLFISVTGLFNNQLNIVRQAFTVYLGTCAAIMVFEDRKRYAALLIVTASLFHISSIIYFIFFVPTKYIKNISQHGLFLILISGLIFSYLYTPELLKYITIYLPDTYAWYIIDDGLGEVGLLNSLTKYIFVPFYFFAIIDYKNMTLSSIHALCFKWGIIGFAFKIAVLNIGLINRLSLGFLIISLFPFYFYIKYLIQKKKYK